MKRKSATIFILVLVAMLSFTLGAYAENPIKIIVNGKTLQPDVSPQIIDGRTMVPIRFVAEALGAKVGWDENTNSVTISTSTSSNSTTLSDQVTGLSKNKPHPNGSALLTPDGFLAGTSAYIRGNTAWSIIHTANMFNDEPAPGYEYILIGVAVTNYASKEEPAHISKSDFALVGSSNIVYKSFEKSVVLPDAGPAKEIRGDMYHGATIAGVVPFYIPKNETNLVLIWDKPWKQENKRFFRIE